MWFGAHLITGITIRFTGTHGALTTGITTMVTIHTGITIITDTIATATITIITITPTTTIVDTVLTQLPFALTGMAVATKTPIPDQMCVPKALRKVVRHLQTLAGQAVVQPAI